MRQERRWRIEGASIHDHVVLRRRMLLTYPTAYFLATWWTGDDDGDGG